MRLGLPALLIAVTTLLVGCNDIHQVKLIRPLPIESIVSLSPSTTEIVASSMASQKLKGRTAADDYPVMAKSAPVVASVKPDYEAIKSIAPNLIVLDSSLYNASDMAKIKELKIATYVFDAKTISDFINQLYELADLMGVQTGEQDYITRIQEAQAAAAASKPSVPVKVAVIMPGHGGAPMISGTKGFLGNVITNDGGIMVGPPVGKFVPLNAETLTNENPDLIIIPTDKDHVATDAKSILSEPTLKATKAVQNNKIAAIDSEILLREGSRVDKLITQVHQAFSLVEPK